MPSTLERHAVALVPADRPPSAEGILDRWHRQHTIADSVAADAVRERREQFGVSYGDLLDPSSYPLPAGVDRETIYRLVDGEMVPINGRWYDPYNDLVTRKAVTDGDSGLEFLRRLPDSIFDRVDTEFIGFWNYGDYASFMIVDPAERPYELRYWIPQCAHSVWVRWPGRDDQWVQTTPWMTHDSRSLDEFFSGLPDLTLGEVPRATVNGLMTCLDHILSLALGIYDNDLRATRREIAEEVGLRLADSDHASVLDLYEALAVSLLDRDVDGHTDYLPQIDMGGAMHIINEQL